MNALRLFTRLTVAAATSMMLAACSSRPEIEVDPSLNADNAGSVYVYRPSSQWMGLWVDFRIMLDGRYIGSLDTGGYVQAFASPGEHSVAVQPHHMSDPYGDPGTVTVNVEQGKSYYIRFSQHLDSVSTLGTMPVTTGHLELHLVPFETWEKRL